VTGRNVVGIARRDIIIVVNIYGWDVITVVDIYGGDIVGGTGLDSWEWDNQEIMLDVMIQFCPHFIFPFLLPFSVM